MLNRPSILWIVTTQWRAQSTGYGGDPNARTPWLDGLAAESVDYAQAVTPHPLGPQARAALLTGRLSPENGVADYYDSLPAEARTVAHALNDRGYATAYFGKWHLFEHPRGLPFVGEELAKAGVPVDRRGGFAVWEGFEGGFQINDPWLAAGGEVEPKRFKGYQSDIVCQRAAEWMIGHGRPGADTGRPFFCVVSVEPPHPPYGAGAGGVRPPDASAIRLRANVPAGGEVEARAREELAGYYAHIEATDRAIGRLIAEVDLAGTAVVFTSVHGDMHGSHGLFRKAWPHEESVRVPLLVREVGKGSRRGRDDSMVSLVDLPHMAVAWAENREWHSRGDSAGISMPNPTDIPHQCPHAWRGFRTARRKLVVRDGGKPWLFFDLENDPLELNNLAEDGSRAAEIGELGRWL